MSDLVKKCGGRCHVIDNKYWKDNPKDEYRSNRFQVKKLLDTLDKITEANKGGCYTNDILQAVEKKIQKEEELIRQSSGNMSEEEITQQAKVSVWKKLWIKLAGFEKSVLLGAFSGVGASVVLILLKMRNQKVKLTANVSFTLWQPSNSDRLSLYSNFTFDDIMDTRRVVILGKTGAGKSSLANTILGEKPFKVDDTANSGTTACQVETRSVNGKNITLVDTPGFFDTDRPEEELKREILRCITECVPGPHAFLIVLKVEKFTEHEKAVINKIRQYFSEEVFKYATVVFTHGDQLKGQTIKEFVCQNKSLSDLVKKCGGHCHVIDNEYWKNSQQDEHKNKHQVEELLKTIDGITEANEGRCYTNEMLQVVQEIIEQKKMLIRESSGNMSEEEITRQAKDRAFKEIWIRLAGVATGALLGALFGVVVMGLAVVDALKELVPAAKTGIAGGAAGAGGLGATGITFISAAAVGAAVGGYKGYHAAEGADTPWEAAKMTAAALKEGAQSIISTIDGVRDCLNVSSKPTYSKLKESEEL
ncbi:hypothetical protein ABVT39_017511 [Epinephelus coioides]